MKIRIATFLFMLCFVLPGVLQAQKNFDEIYKQYKKDENVTGVKINKLGCWLLSSVLTGDEQIAKDLMKKSTSLRLLIVENQKHEALCKDLAEYISSNKLEKLLEVVEGEDNTDFYIEEKNGVIRKLLFVVVDEGEQIVFYIEGRFSLEMIQEMMRKNRTEVGSFF